MNMKYEQIDAERMNEYLGYQVSILGVYLAGNDLTQQQYNNYREMITTLQELNKMMSKLP